MKKIVEYKKEYYKLLISDEIGYFPFDDSEKLVYVLVISWQLSNHHHYRNNIQDLPCD